MVQSHDMRKIGAQPFRLMELYKLKSTKLSLRVHNGPRCCREALFGNAIQFGIHIMSEKNVMCISKHSLLHIPNIAGF